VEKSTFAYINSTVAFRLLFINSAILIVGRNISFSGYTEVAEINAYKLLSPFLASVPQVLPLALLASGQLNPNRNVGTEL